MGGETNHIFSIQSINSKAAGVHYLEPEVKPEVVASCPAEDVLAVLNDSTCGKSCRQIHVLHLHAEFFTSIHTDSDWLH
jgi:hypothetical protein